LVEHGIDINKDNMFKETPLFDIMVFLYLYQKKKKKLTKNYPFQIK